MILFQYPIKWMNAWMNGLKGCNSTLQCCIGLWKTGLMRWILVWVMLQVLLICTLKLSHGCPHFNIPNQANKFKVLLAILTGLLSLCSIPLPTYLLPSLPVSYCVFLPQQLTHSLADQFSVGAANWIFCFLEWKLTVKVAEPNKGHWFLCLLVL